MTRPNAARSAVEAATLAAIALTGCSSSTTPGKGGTSAASSDSSSSASSAPTSSAAAPATAASSSAAGGQTSGANAAACADIKKLDVIGNAADIGNDLTKGRQLLDALALLTAKLAGDAPVSIRVQAQKAAQDVKVLADAANSAKSSAELKAKAQSDPSIKAAGAGLSTNGDAIDSWGKANCK